MAARRRERRSGGGTARADPVVRSPRTGSPSSSSRKSFLLLSSPLVVLLLVGYVAVRHRGSEHRIAGVGDALSAQERGLVKEKVSFQEILNESSTVSSNTTRRNFPNPVLAYVTPWNSFGYEMAEKFSYKLTHISPVWYELKSEGKNFVLEGRHNADLGWISKLRANGQSVVLPRIVLEAFPTEYLQKKKQRNTIVNIIINECKEMGYDGIVLESWSRWAAYGILHDTSMRNMALQFIQQLGQALHSTSLAANPAQHLELVYVIPAPRSQDLKEHDFGPSDLQELSDAVDGFSLMTYDFSGPQSPGPNAPLMWIRSCLQLFLGDGDSGTRALAHKIFLGLNFYGNDFIFSEGFGGEAITGRGYISLLGKHKPVLQWEDRSAEHFFIYSHNNIKHAVFYPSLMSLSKRLDEARAWGTSLSIWEIGQGLDYFFDLL